MDGKLLVRVYNVGLGDCIYLRVPDKARDVHILIDCGNKFNTLELLGRRIAELKPDLPDVGNGQKRLDLLVVSHPHEDHHKGFEEVFFEGIQIERIWLSPAFDRLNPQAQGFHSLKEAAQRALTSLSAFAAGDMKAEVEELLSLSKKEAVDLLCKGLNKGIKPLYVTADTPPEQLKIFDTPLVRSSRTNGTHHYEEHKIPNKRKEAFQYFLGVGPVHDSVLPTIKSLVDKKESTFNDDEWKFQHLLCYERLRMVLEVVPEAEAKDVLREHKVALLMKIKELFYWDEPAVITEVENRNIRELLTNKRQR